MRIEKNLNEVFEILHEAWRDGGKHGQILTETSVSKSAFETDIEYEKDKNNNFIAIGATITGDLSNVRNCCIGDSIDVEIGEGAVVISCAFLRILQLDNEDPKVQEAKARHKIVIAPGCVCIGSIFRDSCSVGNDSTIIDSLVTQATVGADAQMYLSSLMLRFGSVGNRLRMLHSALHCDPCRIGNDVFIVQGNLGLYPAEDVATSFNTALTNHVMSISRLLWSDVFFKNNCYTTLRKFDQRASDIANGVRGYHLEPIVERKQWMCGNNACRELNLKNPIRLATPSGSRLYHDSHIMVVQFSDAIRSKDAKTETYWQSSNHDICAKDFYTSYEPRIRIGNNFRAFMPFAIRVGAASGRSRYGSSYGGTPVGPQKTAWKRFIERDLDVDIGNNVTITVYDDWDEGAYINSCMSLGRLVLKDGATLYERRVMACESSSLETSFNRIRLVDGSMGGLSERCALTVEENGRIYMLGMFTQRSDSGKLAHSHLWNVTVDKNESAVI